MKKLFRSRIRFIFIPILAIGFLFLVSFAVMHLWNYTLPALFGVKAINLWQSMALFFLCKLLFGFGGGGPRRGGPQWSKRAMRRKFAQMDVADKARFNAYMQRDWCRWESWGEPVNTGADPNRNDGHQHQHEEKGHRQ